MVVQGTVNQPKKSWDSAKEVLGQWSWDSGLGTVGQWSWDSGLGTVVLGH